MQVNVKFVLRGLFNMSRHGYSTNTVLYGAIECVTEVDVDIYQAESTSGVCH
jgi:hypothetical protein